MTRGGSECGAPVGLWRTQQYAKPLSLSRTRFFVFGGVIPPPPLPWPCPGGGCPTPSKQKIIQGPLVALGRFDTNCLDAQKLERGQTSLRSIILSNATNNRRARRQHSKREALCLVVFLLDGIIEPAKKSHNKSPTVVSSEVGSEPIAQLSPCKMWNLFGFTPFQLGGVKKQRLDFCSFLSVFILFIKCCGG